MVNHPRVLCVVCLVSMWSLALLGAWLRTRYRDEKGEDKESLGIVVSATLTLLRAHYQLHLFDGYRAL